MHDTMPYLPTETPSHLLTGKMPYITGDVGRQGPTFDVPLRLDLAAISSSVSVTILR